MKLCALAVLLLSQAALAAPNGYVLLAPTKIQRGKDVKFTFTLPCDDERARESAQLITASDDSGDLAVTVGLLYPAGYCMDSASDTRHAKPTEYTETRSAKSLGLDASGSSVVRAKVLPAR